MRPEIRRLSPREFASLFTASASRLTRQIDAVHLHHTWRPTRSQFKGLATIEAMRNVHVHTNGWDDIAQHLTVDPQGFAWTGRNWNLPPASQAGANGTRRQGPFMIEIVGDFDEGRDLLDGAQRQAVIDIVAAILRTANLEPGAIRFHRELGSSKTCPGTGVDKQTLLHDIQAALPVAAEESVPRGTSRGSDLPFAREFVLGHDVAVDPGDAVAGHETWEVPEQDWAAAMVAEEARARLRASAGDSRALASVLERTRSEWAPLRPHVVNLTEGRLSQGGEFDMPAGAIEGIVSAIEHYARTSAHPRVMFHAHGGLVGEKAALRYALAAHRWWLDHGVFPVYFVWETSAFDIIRNRLGLSRGFGDFTDRAFEAIARPAGKPVWGEMKEYALLASSTDAGDGQAGGAWIFAQALSRLWSNPPAGKAISLHAVGHSAGAIFHAHFVPALIASGARLDSVTLLAAALRIDLFKQMLLPRIADGAIARLELYQMDDEAERDDDLIEPLGVPFYGKSLLYLVSGAFEPEQDTPLLGLEASLRRDAELMALFGPGGSHRLELSHARGKPHNPATKARKHGCFDNDDATMRSILQTVTGAGTDMPFTARSSGCEKASSRALVVVWGGAGGTRTGLPPALGAPPPSMPRRRALCVGIDSYATSPLAGCVRDAETWAAALRRLNFAVTTVLDTQATRHNVLEALNGLIAEARPGETLVFQYAGHGTQAEDLNGDEADRYDEALVPVDYESGALLLDDDLADVYRRLPGGAVLTLFMDCCHSGTNSRFAPIDRSPAGGSERRRFLRLTPELEEAHRQYRARTAAPVPTTPEESLPGIIHFAACLDNQFAYESSGQGHFTRVASEALAAAVAAETTNEEFGNSIAARVIALGRPQTPRLMRLPAELAGRPVLAAPAGSAATQPAASTGLASGDRALEQWCLQFLESGVAHLRERLGR